MFSSFMAAAVQLLDALPNSREPETRTAQLFSLLHTYCGPNGDATAPHDLDIQIYHFLKDVLSMSHNQALLRRAHAQASANTLACPPNTTETTGARQAQATLELVYNVIKLSLNGQTGLDPTSAFNTQPPMGSTGRAALFRALDQVGVFAREMPFPDIPKNRGDLVRNCTIYRPDGSQQIAPNGGFKFEVLRPVDSGLRGPYSGSGRSYAPVQTLKKAIYGCVKLAHVVSPREGENQCFRWTDERVAIKCISRKLLNRGIRNENPLKEVRCLSYLTRRMSGALQGPEEIRGDPRYVLPMVDCLEDKDNIYLVMPCLEEEMFTVVESKGGPFPEPEARQYLSQILDGLEVAHSLGLAHHDMSLQNLMTDASGAAVIIDWGMVVRVPLTDQGVAVKIASKNTWPCRCGKLGYLAPELLTASEASPAFDPFKLDIWSCGVMLFVLLAGYPPWDLTVCPINEERFDLIIHGRLADLVQAWNLRMSPEAVQLLQALLVEDPSSRPTIPQIRLSPWFN